MPLPPHGRELEGSHEARESLLFAPSDVPWGAITSQILGISLEKPILHEASVPLLVMPGLPRKTTAWTADRPSAIFAASKFVFLAFSGLTYPSSARYQAQISIAPLIQISIHLSHASVCPSCV